MGLARRDCRDCTTGVGIWAISDVLGVSAAMAFIKAMGSVFAAAMTVVGATFWMAERSEARAGLAVREETKAPPSEITLLSWGGGVSREEWFSVSGRLTRGLSMENWAAARAEKSAALKSAEHISRY